MEPLSLPAQLESLSAIGRYVLDAAAQAGIEPRSAYRLRLAVDEVATNIIVHGHEEGRREGTVEVRAEADDHCLTVALEDRGPAYDPLARAEPENLDRPLEEREPGGLGVFLAIRGVDEFRYERVGDRNRNIFVMRRRSAA
jgi:serine/threonine-protein kinase RsbW